MNCSKIKNSLYDYVEGNLSLQESEEIKKHIYGCPKCQAELKSVKTFYKAINAVKLPEPKYSFDKIMEEVKKRESEGGAAVEPVSVFDRFKLPLGLIAIAASVFIGIYIWYAIEQFSVFKPECENIIVMRTEEKSPEKSGMQTEPPVTAGQPKTIAGKPAEQELPVENAAVLSETKPAESENNMPVKMDIAKKPEGETEIAKKPAVTPDNYYELTYNMKYDPKSPEFASISDNKVNFDKVHLGNGKVIYQPAGESKGENIPFIPDHIENYMAEKIRTEAEKNGGMVGNMLRDTKTYILVQIPSENLNKFKNAIGLSDENIISGPDIIETDSSQTDYDNNKDGFVKIKINLDLSSN